LVDDDAVETGYRRDSGAAAATLAAVRGGSTGPAERRAEYEHLARTGCGDVRLRGRRLGSR
jgi:hypothetical protein